MAECLRRLRITSRAADLCNKRVTARCSGPATFTSTLVYRQSPRQPGIRGYARGLIVWMISQSPEGRAVSKAVTDTNAQSLPLSPSFLPNRQRATHSSRYRPCSGSPARSQDFVYRHARRKSLDGFTACGRRVAVARNDLLTCAEEWRVSLHSRLHRLVSPRDTGQSRLACVLAR
jgi:hypothetical protein